MSCCFKYWMPHVSHNEEYEQRTWTRWEIILHDFIWMQLLIHDLHSTLFYYSKVVLAPFPLTVLRSNSKFDQNLKCSSLKCTGPITTRFCTRHDSYTVAWRVHNFVVIGWVHIELECCIFSSNHEFYRNIVSGTGARSDVWIWLAKKNMIFQPTYQVWLWIVFQIPWVPPAFGWYTCYWVLRWVMH